MPSRVSPEERETKINAASMNAIKQRMGNVRIDNAKEEYITPDSDEIVDQKISPEEEFKEVSETFETIVEDDNKNKKENHTYGANYYKINTQTLPTKGIFYGDAEIYLRNFKVVEVKRLAYIDESSANDVINDIMSKVIQGYDWYSLKTADRIAIIFYVRMNTFPDPSYKINYSCNNKVKNGKGETVTCNSDNKMSFTPNDLNMKYIPEDFKRADQTIKLPGGDVITWRFPEIKDEKAITMATEEIKLAFEKNDGYDPEDVDTDLVSVSHLIESVNGSALNAIEKYLYLTELAGPQSYVIILREITTKYDIGLDPTVECICSKCGGRVNVPVMFSPEFFLPEYTVEKS